MALMLLSALETLYHLGVLKADLIPVTRYSALTTAEDPF